MSTVTIEQIILTFVKYKLCLFAFTRQNSAKVFKNHNYTIQPSSYIFHLFS